MSSATSTGPILSYSGSSTRGRGAPRGARARGRGRGRGYASAIPFPPRKANNTWVAPGLAKMAATSTSQTKAVSAPVEQKPTVAPSQHKKLVLNGPVASTSAIPAAGTSKELSDIVVNGVTFVSDPSGRRLIRKTSDMPTAGTPIKSSDSPADQNTPSRVSVAGQDYVRTKSGNLIAKSLVTKRDMQAKHSRLNTMLGTVKSMQHARSRPQRRPIRPLPRHQIVKKKDSLCRFFTKTGECRNALTCPYIHDSDKVSICPKFLRHSCEQTASTCTLSHSPNAHRMPHCVHFPNCKNGADCMYPHVHVSPTATVCRDFAVIGWCEQGVNCPSKHVNECPEFSSTGKCSTKGCKLPHVIRRKHAAEPESSIPAPPATNTTFEIKSNIEPRAPTKKRKADDMKANEDFVTFMASDDELEEGEVEEGEVEESDEDSSVDSEEFESSSEEEKEVEAETQTKDDVDESMEEPAVSTEDDSDAFDPHSLLVNM